MNKLKAAGLVLLTVVFVGLWYQAKATNHGVSRYNDGSMDSTDTGRLLRILDDIDRRAEEIADGKLSGSMPSRMTLTVMATNAKTEKTKTAALATSNAIEMLENTKDCIKMEYPVSYRDLYLSVAADYTRRARQLLEESEELE